MKKTLIIAALAVPFVLAINTSAHAKVRTAKVVVNRMTESSKYITGKATAGANVKVTRSGFTYAAGTATKNGKFKFKLKDTLSNGWHYKVKVSKKGYKTKTIIFGLTSAKKKQSKPQVIYVPGENTTTVVYQNDQKQIDELKAQIAQLQNQSTYGSTQTTIVQSNANDSKYSQWLELQRQIDSVSDELKVVATKRSQLIDAGDVFSESLATLKRQGKSDVNDNISWLSDLISNLKEKQKKFPQDKSIQEVIDMRENDLKRDQWLLDNFDEYQKNPQKYDDMYGDILTKKQNNQDEYDQLSKQLKDLIQEQKDSLN